MPLCVSCKLPRWEKDFQRRTDTSLGRRRVCAFCRRVQRNAYRNRVIKPLEQTDYFKLNRAPKQQAFYNKQRKRVLELLGGKCTWPGCEWTDTRVLQVDHIKGNGHKERLEKTTRGIYGKILRMQNPQSEYQLLCANHNWIKRAENHEVRWTWLHQSNNKGNE